MNKSVIKNIKAFTHLTNNQRFSLRLYDSFKLKISHYLSPFVNIIHSTSILIIDFRSRGHIQVLIRRPCDDESFTVIHTIIFPEHITAPNEAETWTIRGLNAGNSETTIRGYYRTSASST